MAEPFLKHINTHAGALDSYLKIALSVDCAIFGVEDSELKVLLIRSDLEEFKDKWTLLGDLVYPEEDPDKAAYRVLRKRTGLKNLYLEQVRTFGRPERHPAGRVVTIAYYSLVNIDRVRLTTHASELHWQSVRDIKPLAFDHRLILDTCLQKLRSMGLARHVAYGLLPPKFSLTQLQHVYEAIRGHALDRRNFRKKVLAMDILEDLEEIETDVSHRPGRLSRFKGIIDGMFV